MFGRTQLSNVHGKIIFENCGNRFFQAPVCCDGLCLMMDCHCAAQLRLTGNFRWLNCSPVVICGEKWETVWAFAESCKTSGD